MVAYHVQFDTYMCNFTIKPLPCTMRENRSASGSVSDSNDNSGDKLKDIKRHNDGVQFSSAHLHNVVNTLAPLICFGAQAK